jgi:hypothetical protein
MSAVGAWEVILPPTGPSAPPKSLDPRRTLAKSQRPPLDACAEHCFPSARESRLRTGLQPMDYLRRGGGGVKEGGQ